MEEVITATGKRFNCDYFNSVIPANQVNIRVIGLSLIEAVTIFGNPDETVQLRCGRQYLAHHTKVIAIVPESDAIRIVLGKE